METINLVEKTFLRTFFSYLHFNLSRSIILLNYKSQQRLILPFKYYKSGGGVLSIYKAIKERFLSRDLRNYRIIKVYSRLLSVNLYRQFLI